MLSLRRVRLHLDKRTRFILSAFILGVGLLFIQSVSFSWRYLAVGLWSLAAAPLCLWSLREGLTFKIEWFIIPILPVFFCAGVALFYFLFPQSLFYQMAIFIFLSFGVYITLLVENIFAVASLRTIALLRAAQAIGFLLTLLTTFFLYNTVFSFRFFPWWNAILIFLISLPLFFQSLWTVNLEERIDAKLVLFTAVLSLIVAQVALIVSVLPVNVLTGSLFLTCTSYILLGMANAEIAGRLFRKTIREYLIVGGLMFLTLLLTTSWTG